MTTVIVILAGLVAALLFASWRIARAAERSVPMAGQLCPVDGGTIHYVEMGAADKPALVLMHGLAGVLQHFTYGMAEDLAQDHRVIVLDRPGCGYSTRNSDDLAALPEQARMLWQALDKIGVDMPILVGHSLGGALALAMAMQRPGAARALALICPLTQEQAEIPDVFKPLEVKSPSLRRVLGHTLAVPMARLTTRQVLDAVFTPEPWPQDFLTRGGASLGYRPSAYISATADLVASRSSMADLGARYADALKTPGAILFGAEDALLAPALHGQGMVAHGLPCETVAGRGHMLPITDPQACTAFVRRVANSAA